MFRLLLMLLLMMMMMMRLPLLLLSLLMMMISGVLESGARQVFSGGRQPYEAEAVDSLLIAVRVAFVLLFAFHSAWMARIAALPHHSKHTQIVGAVARIEAFGLNRERAAGRPGETSPHPSRLPFAGLLSMLFSACTCAFQICLSPPPCVEKNGLHFLKRS